LRNLFMQSPVAVRARARQRTVTAISLGGIIAP